MKKVVLTIMILVVIFALVGLISLADPFDPVAFVKGEPNNHGVFYSWCQVFNTCHPTPNSPSF
ncbi:hypothetical protein COT75_04690 [Candidatus Beckwithbacteria bacterium CG10_big_fil_rev_8_21_14_0_10_34_10]|uniref:Uncharacterized protein n=1 Tax=Candidatus Beckwithbacteria bacterium CG10_big_fil_rev_8_21_14_0_10_34_10 TaxID=1974495 RepID=A0A2H0W7V6_9BACT|nr:MAG: hypothetical protein COT75_04690 [Candidatus Beckwithbacteria bacterium CG10_big_fil_rev_8_21_14_0_10_34_10]